MLCGFIVIELSLLAHQRGFLGDGELNKPHYHFTVMIPLELRGAEAEIDGNVSKMSRISSLQKYTDN
jgi:hypothetical protein